MDRTTRIQAVADEYRQLAVSDRQPQQSDLIAAHPDLMPELGAELNKLNLIEKARIIAQSPESDEFDSSVNSLDSSGTELVPSEPEIAPVKIPDYELSCRIGQGGFGEVWLGRNRHEGHFYAVKLVNKKNPIELDGVREYKKRADGNPYLVEIGHVGAVDDHYYYIMSLADDANGSSALRSPEQYEPMTLDRHLSRSGRLPLDEIVSIAGQLLLALQQLHDAGGTHCDVKPANIMRMGGLWKLGDAGLITDSSELPQQRGTLRFWPPEGPRDSMADLYALGKTLFLMLTGAGIARFKEWEQGPLDLADETDQTAQLRELILRACHDNPAKRFQSAADMRREIDRIPVTVQSQDRSRFGWPIAAVAVALVLALGYLAIVQPWKNSNRQPITNKELALTGTLDMTVSNESRRHMRLVDPGALPLRVKDQFFIDVKLNQPAYTYILWIDSKGNVLPVHPWVKGAWADRPTEEVRSAQFSVPARSDKAYEMEPGPSGMETIVLLAREEPLPADIDLEALLAGLNELPLKDPNVDSMFSCVNGTFLTGKPDQQRKVDFSRTHEAKDPVLKNLRVISKRLARHFTLVRAISFPFNGEE